jgi:hypothetical protein
VEPVILDKVTKAAPEYGKGLAKPAVAVEEDLLAQGNKVMETLAEQVDLALLY